MNSVDKVEKYIKKYTIFELVGFKSFFFSFHTKILITLLIKKIMDDLHGIINLNLIITNRKKKERK